MNENKQPHSQDARLTDADADVLDQFVEAGFDPDALEHSQSEDFHRRARALQRLFGLLDDYPIDDDNVVNTDDDMLVHATLARVQRATDERAERLRFDVDATRPRRRIRVPDLVSIAAIILIGVGILWPVVGEVHRRSVDAACVANLASLAGAFESYAQDHQSRVPALTAGWGQGNSVTWVDPYPLVKQGYCDAGHLHCPGHQGTLDFGYSRQLIINIDNDDRGIRWATGPLNPIMGDRNPLLDARQHANVTPLDPRMNSANHGNRGQNVLNRDGSVRWLERPFMDSDDNIWLIKGQSTVEPGETPSSLDDIFLVH